MLISTTSCSESGSSSSDSPGHGEADDDEVQIHRSTSITSEAEEEEEENDTSVATEEDHSDPKNQQRNQNRHHRGRQAGPGSPCFRGVKEDCHDPNTTLPNANNELARRKEEELKGEQQASSLSPSSCDDRTLHQRTTDPWNEIKNTRYRSDVIEEIATSSSSRDEHLKICVSASNRSSSSSSSTTLEGNSSAKDEHPQICGSASNHSSSSSSSSSSSTTLEGSSSARDEYPQISSNISSSSSLSTILEGISSLRDEYTQISMSGSNHSSSSSSSANTDTWIEIRNTRYSGDITDEIATRSSARGEYPRICGSALNRSSSSSSSTTPEGNFSAKDVNPQTCGSASNQSSSSSSSSSTTLEGNSSARDVYPKISSNNSTSSSSSATPDGGNECNSSGLCDNSQSSVIPIGNKDVQERNLDKEGCQQIQPKEDDKETEKIYFTRRMSWSVQRPSSSRAKRWLAEGEHGINAVPQEETMTELGHGKLWNAIRKAVVPASSRTDIEDSTADDAVLSEAAEKENKTKLRRNWHHRSKSLELEVIPRSQALGQGGIPRSQAMGQRAIHDATPKTKGLVRPSILTADGDDASDNQYYRCMERRRNKNPLRATTATPPATTASGQVSDQVTSRPKKGKILTSVKIPSLEATPRRQSFPTSSTVQGPDGGAVRDTTRKIPFVRSSHRRQSISITSNLQGPDGGAVNDAKSTISLLGSPGRESLPIRSTVSGSDGGSVSDTDQRTPRPPSKEINRELETIDSARPLTLSTARGHSAAVVTWLLSDMTFQQHDETLEASFKPQLSQKKASRRTGVKGADRKLPKKRMGRENSGLGSSENDKEKHDVKPLLEANDAAYHNSKSSEKRKKMQVSANSDDQACFDASRVSSVDSTNNLASDVMTSSPQTKKDHDDHENQGPATKAIGNRSGSDSKVSSGTEASLLVPSQSKEKRVDQMNNEEEFRLAITSMELGSTILNVESLLDDEGDGRNRALSTTEALPHKMETPKRRAKMNRAQFWDIVRAALNTTKTIVNNPSSLIQNETTDQEHISSDIPFLECESQKMQLSGTSEIAACANDPTSRNIHCANKEEDRISKVRSEQHQQLQQEQQHVGEVHESPNCPDNTVISSNNIVTETTTRDLNEPQMKVEIDPTVESRCMAQTITVTATNTPSRVVDEDDSYKGNDDSLNASSAKLGPSIIPSSDPNTIAASQFGAGRSSQRILHFLHEEDSMGIINDAMESYVLRRDSANEEAKGRKRSNTFRTRSRKIWSERKKSMKLGDSSTNSDDSAATTVIANFQNETTDISVKGEADSPVGKEPALRESQYPNTMSSNANCTVPKIAGNSFSGNEAGHVIVRKNATIDTQGAGFNLSSGIGCPSRIDRVVSNLDESHCLPVHIGDLDEVTQDRSTPSSSGKRKLSINFVSFASLWKKQLGDYAVNGPTFPELDDTALPISKKSTVNDPPLVDSRDTSSRGGGQLNILADESVEENILHVFELESDDDSNAESNSVYPNNDNCKKNIENNVGTCKLSGSDLVDKAVDENSNLDALNTGFIFFEEESMTSCAAPVRASARKTREGAGKQALSVPNDTVDARFDTKDKEGSMRVDPSPTSLSDTEVDMFNTLQLDSNKTQALRNQTICKNTGSASCSTASESESRLLYAASNAESAQIFWCRNKNETTLVPLEAELVQSDYPNSIDKKSQCNLLFNDGIVTLRELNLPQSDESSCDVKQGVAEPVIRLGTQGSSYCYNQDNCGGKDETASNTVLAENKSSVETITTQAYQKQYGKSDPPISADVDRRICTSHADSIAGDSQAGGPGKESLFNPNVKLMAGNNGDSMIGEATQLEIEDPNCQDNRDGIVNVSNLNVVPPYFQDKVVEGDPPMTDAELVDSEIDTSNQDSPGLRGNVSYEFSKSIGSVIHTHMHKEFTNQDEDWYHSKSQQLFDESNSTVMNIEESVSTLSLQSPCGTSTTESAIDREQRFGTNGSSTTITPDNTKRESSKSSALLIDTLSLQEDTKTHCKSDAGFFKTDTKAETEVHPCSATGSGCSIIHTMVGALLKATKCISVVASKKAIAEPDGVLALKTPATADDCDSDFATPDSADVKEVGKALLVMQRNLSSEEALKVTIATMKKKMQLIEKECHGHLMKIQELKAQLEEKESSASENKEELHGGVS